MENKKPDFYGWATRNDMLCTDGRTIKQGAFKEQDGQKVPLVWNHRYDDPANTLGHVILRNKPEGVRVEGYFNHSVNAEEAKEAVKHLDITALSIRAGGLVQKGNDVLHGIIREVSLVHAGANPGAFIDNVMIHGVLSDDEAEIFTDQEIDLTHLDESETTDSKELDLKDSSDLEDTKPKKEDAEMAEEKKESNQEIAHADAPKEKTVQEIVDSMTEEQKNVMYALVGQAIEDTNNDGGNEMKHNVFDQDQDNDQAQKDEELIHTAITEAKRFGSLKESFLSHGITDVDFLFPDAKNVTNQPTFISRDTGWVNDVMSNVHHTPFSRIKSTFANITEDEARAKGYIKGNEKKDEVFTLLKRTTTPTTVYKKQSMDRDDVVDITDFDVIGWMKAEMRLMLDEELARAYLISDGRLASSDDKINEQNIRPIWKDDDLYTIKSAIEVSVSMTPDQVAKAFIRAVIKSRKNYKGSGNPTLYCTEDILTDCLLIEDSTGRIIYESVAKLATTLRVKNIVTVPVMEAQTRTAADAKVHTLLGLVVNLQDYNVGADKGGSVNMFDDFDIDFNKQKYLIETRCSGALTVPYSAIAIETYPAT